MKTKIIILILFLTAIQINAEIRFVSKSGSSIAPYTSWQTAADRIQKAIDISKRRDTIYVGNGTYVDTVRMTPGIALIGSGMDSCIIDSRTIAKPTDFYTVIVGDNCTFSGFHIRVSKDGTGSGIGCLYFENGCLVNYNKISEVGYAIFIGDSNPTIKNNIFSPGKYGRGIDISSMSYRFCPVVDSNYFFIDGNSGIIISFGTKPTITNNVFNITRFNGHAYIGGQTDTVKFLNNIIICDSILEAVNNSHYPTLTINNLIIGKTNYAAINGENRNLIINNIVQGGKGYGLNVWDGAPVFKYNNSWNNKYNFNGFIPDSTNLSADPMFVNQDSLDFHLQKFSPMIDRGSPDLLDKDGTRSDIGPYGGLLGNSYNYIDFPPQPPRNITGGQNQGKIILNWLKNTEADLAFYRIYRDTVSFILKDTSKRYIKLTDTAFTDNLQPGKNYYYRLTATDKQGNESTPSEPVGIITGVNGKPVVSLPDYILYQNYPNPFNPSTVISYKLKNRGYVKINIYDIKGSLIKTLVNNWQDAGYYETEFNASGMKLASGIYLYKIDIKNEKNIPVYTEIKKMAVIK